MIEQIFANFFTIWGTELMEVLTFILVYYFIAMLLHYVLTYQN